MSTPTPDNSEESLFEQAIALPSREARAAFLRRACGDDADLCRRVDRLLAAHEKAGGFMKTQEREEDPERTVVEAAPLSEGPGSAIGRYKLLQQIGEGGMGVVYMAEQTEPVTRKVALKIIKLGMDTRQVVARFEAERQALALMDHPNIAKVLDGGATDTGRPYFVMELVQGVPITEFCDRNKLPARERLQLFIPVCQAIQSAHQKGIIHRDVKPSNVLVTLNHGEPTPKVIDFGIAKATNQKLTEKTLFTQFATMIGTPAYMSPEQAEMTSLDIDTRTDVYSLGVLLYELLTGTTPFPEKRLRSAGYGEMQRIIAEEEPEKPSTRLSTMLNEEGTSVAKSRAMDVSRLRRLLRGDLDWITMKCLEKDRRRRYETANGLAADLKRHLNDEPVSAAAPTLSYQLLKFHRRNRSFMRVAALVAVLLLGATVFSTYQAIRAHRLGKGLAEEVVHSTRMKDQADAARKRAEELGEQESRLRAAAEKQTLEARRMSYATDISLAQQMLEKDNLGRARSLLLRHKPKADGQDFRGWEWRYLAQFCRSDELETLGSFGTELWQLEISSDGRWLIVARFNPWVYSLWDLKNRRHVRDFSNQTTPRFFRPAFSPTEPLMAWCTADEKDGASTNVIELINVETMTTVRRISIPHPASLFRFSPDGSQLLGISCFTDVSPISVWDVRTGEQISQVKGPPYGGRGLYGHPFEITRDLKSVVYPQDRGWISKYDLETQAQLWSVEVSDELVVSMTLSPDGETLAVSEGYDASGIYLYDFQTGILKGRLDGHQAWVSRMQFLDGGQTLVSASADQTIRFWNPETLELIRILHGHENEVRDLVLVPGSKQMLSAGKDARLKVWSTEPMQTDPPVIDLEGSEWTQWVFSGDEQSVHVLDRSQQLWKLTGPSFQTRRRDDRFDPTAPKLLVDFRDQDLLVEGLPTGEIRVHDLRTGRVLHSISTGNEPVAPRAWDGNKFVVFKLSESGKFRILDVSDPGRRIDLEMENFGFPAPAESDSFVWGYQRRGSGVSIERISQGKLIPFGIVRENFLGAQFSADGRLLLMAHNPGVISQWEYDATAEKPVKTGEYSGALMAYREPIILKNKSRFLTVSAGRDAVSIWDLQSQQLLISLEAPQTSDSQPRVSANESMIGRLSSFGDSIRIWRAPSFEEIEAMERGDERKRIPILNPQTE